MCILLAALLLYVRGWLRGRKLIHYQQDYNRLLAFCIGLAVVFLAVASPLDAFDSLFLSAHMAQHLLLMMLAPPLVAARQAFPADAAGAAEGLCQRRLSTVPCVAGLEADGGGCNRATRRWLIFAINTVFWHLPYFYELALRSSVWHGVQHACFFWSGVLFWWPVFERHAKWPRWIFIPYLLLGDLVNTALSAYFVFSGTLLYPSYGLVRANGMKAIDDQILAGLIMWVPGSLVYLIPAFALAMHVISGRSSEQPLTFERIRKRKPAFPCCHL